MDDVKYSLRIYVSGEKDPSYIVTSNIPLIMPRIGDHINTFGFDQKGPERILKVTKVTHWIYCNNSWMSNQTVNIETEIAS